MSNATLAASTLLTVISIFIIALRCGLAQPWIFIDAVCTSFVRIFILEFQRILTTGPVYSVAGCRVVRHLHGGSASIYSHLHRQRAPALNGEEILGNSSIRTTPTVRLLFPRKVYPLTSHPQRHRPDRPTPRLPQHGPVLHGPDAGWRARQRLHADPDQLCHHRGDDAVPTAIHDRAQHELWRARARDGQIIARRHRPVTLRQRHLAGVAVAPYRGRVGDGAPGNEAGGAYESLGSCRASCRDHVGRSAVGGEPRQQADDHLEEHGVGGRVRRAVSPPVVDSTDGHFFYLSHFPFVSLLWIAGLVYG
jgi:hypothetical protein